VNETMRGTSGSSLVIVVRAETKLSSRATFIYRRSTPTNKRHNHTAAAPTFRLHRERPRIDQRERERRVRAARRRRRRRGCRRRRLPHHRESGTLVVAEPVSVAFSAVTADESVAAAAALLAAHLAPRAPLCGGGGVELVGEA
jgi:hypothetical protein